MSRPEVGCVAIIGVGLIGGSFGMALKKRGLADKVIGVGRNASKLERAVELEAVDEWSTELSAVREADLVYIATPVGMELEFIRNVALLVRDGCVITDGGSTKGEICRGADSLVPRFVGGHPMAGSEATGVEAGSPDLFVNATYILTPTKRTDPEALRLVRGLAEGVGARVVEMDPESHDRCAAVISHLPHMLAAALVSLAESRSRIDPHLFDLVAGSFRDMTRVAGSSPDLWRDICLTNMDEIRQSVQDFSELLNEGLQRVIQQDSEAVEEWFSEAKQIRDAKLKR